MVNYKDIIESRYNRTAWQELLHDIFKSGAQFLATPFPVDARNPIAVSSLQLGTITLNDDSKIAVYEIKLADNVDMFTNRVGIRNLLIHDWKMKGCVGAFIFCYRDNESVLRFSYVSSSMKFDEEGKMQREETDTKRFTYILGEGHRSRTAIEQFMALKNSSLMLADLTKAFSVEALSDRFFKDYKGIYDNIIEFVTGKRVMKIKNKYEEKVIKAPNAAIMSEFADFENPEKAVRDYVKRLMGRIVFLQFIQKKGWLGVPVGAEWGAGDKEFLQNLYDRSDKKDNFIDVVLEAMFNDINTKRENDFANPILGKGIKIPYLNGGLFERDKADKCTFRLPKEQLDKMFNFFSSYNFTIDENDPDDAEIGVDPEMLGRIFENLLEDNKDKGAFYTPKEIVQYMCRESLIAYLETGREESDKEVIRQFVTTNDVSLLNSSLKEDIDNKLINVKICDPAIGSGAFPMGLLKELYACRSAIEGLDDENAAEIKKHIIQNNIYGVDIEKGAVDIARLRFWLSIIVDEKTPHALPNMDFKIMQGNSLIPTFDGKYVNLTDTTRHTNSIHISRRKKELSELQNQYYGSEGERKKELLVEIKYLILEIVRLQMDYEYNYEAESAATVGDIFSVRQAKTVNVDEEKAKVIGQCKRLQQSLRGARPLDERSAIQIPFFDWKIMFSDVFNADEHNGFNIVIGNPPYIQIKKLKEKDVYSEVGFYTYQKSGDIYCLFYEIATNLLASNGISCYITSNKWLRSVYGKSLRNFLVNKSNPFKLIDLGAGIFESATVDTNILLWSKAKYRKATACTSSNDIRNLSFVKQAFKNDDIWAILSATDCSLKEIISQVKTTLASFPVQLNYGILTGANPVFIIDEGTAQHLISLDEKNKEVIKPILRGKDISRYSAKFAGVYLINTHNGVKSLNIPPINIKNYPTLKRYFESFGVDFKLRGEQGDNWWNLRNCAFILEYTKPKILYSDIVQDRGKFYYDEEGYYANDTAFMISGKQLKYLIAILNSTVFTYIYKKFYSGGGLGESGLRYKKEFLLQVPIPKADMSTQIEIENIVDKIIALKKEAFNSDVSELEDEIDDIVCKLYGLSDVDYISIL